MMEETLPGVYEMKDVLYGGVLVKEKTAPEGFKMCIRDRFSTLDSVCRFGQKEKNGQ